MTRSLLLAITLVLCFSSTNILAQSNNILPPLGAVPQDSFRVTKTAQVLCPRESSCYMLSGYVHVKLLVNSDGVPVTVTAVSGDTRLRDPVEEAAKKYRFIFLNAPQKDSLKPIEFDIRVSQTAGK